MCICSRWNLPHHSAAAILTALSERSTVNQTVVNGEESVLTGLWRIEIWVVGFIIRQGAIFYTELETVTSACAQVARHGYRRLAATAAVHTHAGIALFSSRATLSASASPLAIGN